ncbi:MAG: phosphatidylserine decarboxylase [Clostridia bacterium]|nr:phosphatidylserine decarboxylase [Clostridia bacterium]
MYENLYRSKIGVLIASLIARPGISRAAGCFMDSRMSIPFIKPFIRKNGIDMTAAAPKKYVSFNDFFTRRLREGARPFDERAHALPAPCDGLLTVYEATRNGVFTVKGSPYTMETLIDNKEIAQSFEGGWLLVFRLTPAHYHRYAFPDHGRILKTRRIQGVYHTVRPEALQSLPVFKTNTREYALIETENFGRMIYMEVGATMVGRIQNDVTSGSFTRGQEKGRFEFGGSTIILITEKGKCTPLIEMIKDTQSGLETPVLMGQAVCLLAENGERK